MSSQKGLVQRIERKLEATVGDVFARMFGGSIVPQELEALLYREAADGLQHLQGNRLLAPNEYVITLSVYDFEKLGADPDLPLEPLAQYLTDYIHEKGWQTYGDVVVRFEQSSNLHTGQFRARGAVNPDIEPRPPGTDSAGPQSNHAFGAESGVPPMSDNSSYRGGQGQGRPGDEYYDDRYGHPQEDPRGGLDPQGGPDPRGGYPSESGGYPPQYIPPRQSEPAGYPEQTGYPDHGQGGYPDQRGYPDQAQGGYPDQRGYPDHGQGGYPDQRGYPDQAQGGYPPSYEQRPPAPAGYGGPGYQQGAGGYGPPPGGQPGYGGYGDYPPGGREPTRHDEGGYAPPGPTGIPEQRQAYPDQGAGYEPGYQQGGAGYGQQEYAQADFTRYADNPPGGAYAPPGGGYAEVPNRDYDYGQPAADHGQLPSDYAQQLAEYGQPPSSGYGGYEQGGYPSAGTAVTLQLDDGSGRTYQLRDGSNVVGRGQDAQFRLPDTVVSRRHLDIRWDGQVALLSDLNSTNGTTVNNAPIQEWQLADGDVIRLGHSEIIVRIH